MKVDYFLEKHNIKLSEWALKAYKDGCAHMEKSKDPVGHGAWHVSELLYFLDKFLDENEEVEKKDINFDILMSAIAWHDVWKSRKKQTFNLIIWIYQQYYEGIGSKKIFQKYANKSSLPQEESEEIAYAILNHCLAANKKKKRKTEIEKHLEACILYDIDSLSAWNIRKYKNLTKIFCHKDLTLKRPFFRHIIKYHYRTYSKDRPKDFYLRWTQKEFKLKKEKMLEWADNFLRINKIKV